LDYLVVVDMQNDFVDGSLGTEEAVNIIDNVVSEITNFTGQVLFTCDTHDDNYENTVEGNFLPVRHCIQNTKGWAIQEKVKEALDSVGAIGFLKETFGCESLVDYLKNQEKVDSIGIIGLCTDICVISNALTLKTYFPNTEIWVRSNACAGVTPKSHENALSAMKMCHIKII